LDVRVAVRLDLEMLVASLGQELSEWGRECRGRGQIRDLEAEDGGAGAAMDDPECGLLGVWVGVVNGVLTALEKGFTFSSIFSRTRGADPEEHEFAEIAAGLTPRALIGLVARQAVADRYFAALLLACAGRLTPAGPKEIDAVRQVIAAAAEVPNGRRWELHDIVTAGRAMVVELELLAVRPFTDETLIVVEEAIAVWATLSGYLKDAWETYETEPEEVGTALADLHLRLCQAHDPEPLELATRLAKLVRDAEGETFLGVSDEYADVLGEQALARFEALLARR